MNRLLHILPTTLEDLPAVHKLFDHSIAYQEKHGYPSWKGYDKNALVKDVNDGNQYKILADGEIVMAFSICYTDKVIWRDKENGSSIYLHRVVVNPAFKGQRLFGELLRWTEEHAQEKGLRTIRMDTWDKNPPLLAYYKSYGFVVIEHYTLPDSPELPVHNRNMAVILLERPLG